MEVQGCRLPGFKTRQNSPNASLQLPGATQAGWSFPAAPTSPWSRGNVLLWRFKAAVCQPSQLAKTPQTLIALSVHRPGATQATAISVHFPRATHAAISVSTAFPDATGRGRPCAAPTSPWSRGNVLLRRFKAAVCQASKLAKTPQTLPCSSQAPLRPRWTFPAAPTSPWSRGNVLLWRFKAAVCQASKLAKTPQTLPCSSQAPLRLRWTFPAAPTSPWSRGNVLLWRFKAAVCQASKLAKTPQTLPCSSNKSLKPWQCPFMAVQGCRLPGFKTRQNSPNASLQLPGATQAAVNLSCSSNKSLKPWQCLFMEVQGCRLPAFKTRQNSPNASLQLQGATQAAVNLSCSSNKSRSRGNVLLWTLPCSSQAPLRPRWTFPAAPTSPWGRGSVLLRRFKAAVCQASKLAKTPQTLPCSSQAPLRPRWTFPAAQQVPEAVAMSFYGGSRLPFARLQNSPKLSKRFPAAPRRHSGRVILSCSSNKSLKPWQCPFMEVQGCRLPAFTTRQNSPNAYSTLCSPPRSHSGSGVFLLTTPCHISWNRRQQKNPYIYIYIYP